MRASIRCACGEVRGQVNPAEPSLSNRGVCYCDDCQTFAHYLGRADLLDAQGGSDIVQVPPSVLTFTQGQSRIGAVRLGPKGLLRWRACCCNTPLGNMRSPAMPFVGLLASIFRIEGQDPDALFGPPRGAIMGQFAIGEPPAGSKGVGFTLMVTTVARVLRWRLQGRSWPHPFFDRATGEPLYPVVTITRQEREQLRRLCGPHPV